MSWAIWITGLPGSGKTAIARAVAAALIERGVRPTMLELDAIRKILTPAPTYSASERELVYRVLVYLAKALTDQGIPVIIDATAHRRAWRDLARAAIPNFAEIQLVCPLEVCRQREAERTDGHAPRGIYAAAGRPRATVPGVDVPYEAALAPEVVVDTTRNDVAAAVAEIVPVALALAAVPASLPTGGGAWAMWITGLPGSGKTTVASELADRLAARGIPAALVDLVDIQEFVLGRRTGTPLENEILHRALVVVAMLLTRAGIPVIIDATAPRRAWRRLAREVIPNFAEVQLICPAPICARRERAGRWTPPPCAHAGRPGTAVTDGPDIAPDYETSLEAELIVYTDVRDLASEMDEILALALGLYRSASRPAGRA